MPLQGTDAEIRSALDDVNLPTMLVVLACITDSDEWLNERYTPAPIEAPEGSMFPDDSGRYSEAIAEEIKSAAVRILGEVRDGKRDVPPPPTQARLQQLLSFSIAEPVDEGYAAMLMEETRFRDRDDLNVNFGLLVQCIQDSRPIDAFVYLVFGQSHPTGDRVFNLVEAIAGKRAHFKNEFRIF